MGRSIKKCVALSVVVILSLTLVGCSRPKKPAMTPQVAPPVVGKAGVLTAGVDMSYPPFAGTENGKDAGIDIDVASALAAKLGLKVALVDVKPSDVATALASGKVDVVMSVPLTAESLSGAGMAGTYISDGPALFVLTDGASAAASMTIESIGVDSQAGVQKGSAAYWELLRLLGTEESMRTFDTLGDAMAALVAGEVKVVAGDALVGAYMARDLPGVAFAGSGGIATPLGVAVNPDNTALSEAVSKSLDRLAADGVLETIRRKWVGSLPELEVSPDTGAGAPQP